MGAAAKLSAQRQAAALKKWRTEQTGKRAKKTAEVISSDDELETGCGGVDQAEEEEEELVVVVVVAQEKPAPIQKDRTPKSKVRT